ncbi:unnamed protein product [marine sediment metagenome]|uniref:GFO/IDH/MocA-like oxidoreductase domain-containing protein n=1 Tax=marine sediment metagenome TaxID=412755 RepID=X0UVM4_9ZZZZ
MAAKYRIPVICQKPMSETFKSCLRMYKACKDAGIPFFIHENYRYRSKYQQFKSLLKENIVGKIRRAEIFVGSAGRIAFSRQPYLKKFTSYILEDSGTHIFDLMRYFFGEPQSIYTNTIQTYHDIPTENYMASLIKYKDMICSVLVGEKGATAIFVDGEDGTLELKLDGRIFIETKGKSEIRKIPKFSRYKWDRHIRDYYPDDLIPAIIECNRSFKESFITGESPPTDAADNLKTMEIIFAARESVEKNIAVELKFGRKL